jgi:Purine catabolism regulatory protein-like family/PucR C-terminal helix-turn-helix domain/GGDEF-like domain
MATQDLTLGALLDQEELSLRLVVGDGDCRGQVVRGVHCTEVEHPSSWLEPGWVMLTTGMRFVDDADEQRSLVAELSEAGLVALGFGTGMTFDTIPEPIVEEARRRQFPLFEVPYATRFSEVSTFAARSSISRDFHVLRRTVSMQNYLMESLDDASPEEELIRRLGAVLDSDIALYRPDGQLEEVFRRNQRSNAHADWGADVWAEVCRRPPTLQRFSVGDARVVSSPVEADGRIHHWLVVVGRGYRASEQLAQPVVEAAGRLLAVMANARRISVSEEREIRRAFVADLATADPATLGSLGERAASLGLTFAAPVRAVQLAVDGPQWQRLERTLAGTHQRFVIAEYEGRIVCLAEGEDDVLAEALDAVEPVRDRPAVGVGRAADSVHELARSLNDAALALAQLEVAEDGATTLWFDDFDIVGCLVSGAPEDAVRARVDQLLGTIQAKPQLYETLRCFLDCDLDVGRSADALHLHPNSLRYRLARIELSIGASLRHPATIANLYVATMLDATR